MREGYEPFASCSLYLQYDINFLYCFSEGVGAMVRYLPPNSKVPGSIPDPRRRLNIWHVTFFPTEVHSASFHPSEVGKIPAHKAAARRTLCAFSPLGVH